MLKMILISCRFVSRTDLWLIELLDHDNFESRATACISGIFAVSSLQWSSQHSRSIDIPGIPRLELADPLESRGIAIDPDIYIGHLGLQNRESQSQSEQRNYSKTILVFFKIFFMNGQLNGHCPMMSLTKFQVVSME